ncbi:MAG: MFS transporter [Bacillota bacterium]|nr:MFS transporter [Bacillota bacterium]
MKNFGFRKLMIFIILSATVAIAYQLPYLRYTFYDQMMAALNLNDVQMGVLASAVSIASTISYPIGGFLANRFSMRSLINLTLAAFVVLTVCFAFTTNYVFLIGIHVLYGFFGIATLWSAYLVGIRNLGDESVQSKLFGFSEATRGILQTLLGFAFLGIMGAAAAPAMGFKTMLIVGAVVTGVFLVLGFIFLPKKEQDDNMEAQTESEKKYTIVDVLKNPGVWITIIILTCGYACWSFGNGYLTTYTVRVAGLSETTASFLGMIRSYVIVFIAGFLGGWVLDKFTYKGKAFLILFILSAGCFAAVMFSSKALAVCVGLTLFVAFIANIMKSTYWSIMGQAGIPSGMTALATGFISLIIFLPDAILPTFIGTWLNNAEAAGNIAAGFDRIFIMLIIFAVIGILGSILLTRRTKKIDSKGQMEK